MLRMVACLIDTLALILGTIVFLLAMAQLDIELSGSMWRVVVISLLALIMFIIPVLVETLSKGRSLGKLIMGTQVVRDDGGPITLRHALVRWATAPLELWTTLGGIAFCVVMFQPRGKRLGDLAAGTMVIKARAPKPLKPVQVPFGLQQWASNVVIVPPPHALTDNARAFARQQARLVPLARRQGALSLAQQLYPYVNPKPPAGTSPEDFVNALVAIMREKTTTHLIEQFDADSRRRELTLATPWGL